MDKVRKSDDEWRRQLSPQQFEVARQKGTEIAFTGKYWDNKEHGLYSCVCCGLPLFSSVNKFNSGTGWPSFYQPLVKENVTARRDTSHGMDRVEVLCSRCEAHLGHVFDDGPPPTGLRYCINSASLSFTKDADDDDDGTLRMKPPKLATFGAGCFWGVEEAFRTVKGVTATAVGYMGGTVANPTYEMVCSHTTGHAEVVQLVYDPALISYEDLLRTFWDIHDPTTLNRQGPDVGDQYRSVIFFHDPEQEKAARASIARLEKDKAFGGRIVTEVSAAKEFWRAEEYHQRYLQKNRTAGCHVPRSSR